jgi:hypothetical protein
VAGRRRAAGRGLPVFAAAGYAVAIAGGGSEFQTVCVANRFDLGRPRVEPRGVAGREKRARARPAPKSSAALGAWPEQSGQRSGRNRRLRASPSNCQSGSDTDVATATAARKKPYEPHGGGPAVGWTRGGRKARPKPETLRRQRARGVKPMTAQLVAAAEINWSRP